MLQYLKLKQKALEVVNNRKIFTVKGKNAYAVRKALLDRGWVEKLPTNNATKEDHKNGAKVSFSETQKELMLSSYIAEYNPNFVWGEKQYQNTDQNLPEDCDGPIRNSLKVMKCWSTKARLYKSLKNTSWHYIENVAEISAPRTYSNANNSDLREFINDYNLTACTSLLTWILAKILKNKPVFKDTGTISVNVFIFALNRCKDYLLMKENWDVDGKLCTVVTPAEWNFFLMKYRSLMSGTELFKIDEDRNMPLLIAYAKCLLGKILKYRPQLRCEGCCNIWIVKPSDCCNGKGITISSKLDRLLNIVIKTRKSYVIQKYIEEPFLIYGTKFDIRQYYLITSTHPLEIWMYKDCFLKFCSQKYSLKSHHKSIHLTNHAVQKRYKNCSDRHPGLPENNFSDLNMLKKYLKDIGKGEAWDDVIYPGMKKIIIGIMLSSQDYLINSKNRFGFYCCDFLLDNEFKPWLIEIDTSRLYPSNDSRICHQVISDIIKVVIDYAQNSKASTGHFECIYRQPMTPPLKTDDRTNTIEITGVALQPNYFYSDEVRETIKRENEEKETINVPVNEKGPEGEEWKTLSSNCGRGCKVKSIIHKMDALFDLAIASKSDIDIYLNVDSKKEKLTMTQTESGWMTEPDFDGFGFYNVVVDPKKKTSSYMTQTTFKMKELGHNDYFNIKSDKLACAYQVETDSNVLTEKDFSGFSHDYYFDVDPHIKAFAYSQTEPDPLIKPNYYDHLDLNPYSNIATYKTETNSGRITQLDNCFKYFYGNSDGNTVASKQTESGSMYNPAYDDHLHFKPDNEIYKIATNLCRIIQPNYNGYNYLDVKPDMQTFTRTQTESGSVTEPDYDHHLDYNLTTDTNFYKTEIDSGGVREPDHNSLDYKYLDNNEEEKIDHTTQQKSSAVPETDNENVNSKDETNSLLDTINKFFICKYI